MRLVNTGGRNKRFGSKSRAKAYFATRRRNRDNQAAGWAWRPSK